MAIQNLQASSAIAVVPSDTIDIPNPAAVVASGTTTSAGTGPTDNLIDTNATFTDGSVSIGNIVHDTRVGVIDTVAAIVDDNKLTLTNGTNIGSGSTYNIYDHTAKAQPSLYVGVTGDVSVEMAGTGSAITYKGVPAGATLPINVTRVNSTNTTATDIVALF